MKLSRIFLPVVFQLILASVGSASDDAQRLERVKKLYNEEKWGDTAKEAQGPADQAAEFDYYEGMALARLGRWSDAREAFSQGVRKAPADARFLAERAGAEYRLSDYGAAKQDLRRTLRLDPGESYAAEFLGTIYLLEGNLEAALKYWNRLDKPRLTAVEAVPTPKTQKTLMERAVKFGPPGSLQRDQLLETEALLKNLDVFPRRRTELTAGEEDGFKATLRMTETGDWKTAPVATAIAWLRGSPYETVYPSWYGIRGEAVNVESLLRWDSEKRRAGASVEFPVFHQPTKRLKVFFDARNENWDLSKTFTGAAAPASDVNLKRFLGGAELHMVESGWWDWTAGVEAASREFRNRPEGLSHDSALFFTDGRSMDAWLGFHRWLMRLPERRLTVESNGEVRGGRNYSTGLGAFGGVRGEVASRWLPKASGDDWEAAIRLRGGETFGDVPLDLLYQLGTERDNDLWLRGNGGTRDGRKGAAPLGRRYFLVNSELNKNVYEGAFFRVQIGPFFDSGAIADPSGEFGSRKWLFDAGIQARIRVLGSVSVVLSYGRDLRNGTGLFYATSVQ